MPEDKLRRMQLVQIDMLKELKRICEKHGIKYFLVQGTLIGAVRHGGFIPWDDDIDVLMPLEDILKLEKIFEHEAPPYYHLQNYHTELFCPLQWTKIRKDNTTSMPAANKYLPIHWGICIDIFPFYNVSDNKLFSKLQWLGFKVINKLLFHSMKKYTHEMRGLNKKIISSSAYIRRFICEAITKTLLLSVKEGKNVFAMCKGGRSFEKRVFYDGNIKLNFEGEEYSVPAHYDEFLREYFGDYMTPPPPEEQKGHELKMGEIYWDDNKHYSDFR